jgi:hypothetical protein
MITKVSRKNTFRLFQRVVPLSEECGEEGDENLWSS